MGKSKRELLESMDSRELSEWEALYSIEPLPEDRADLRAGVIASATIAPHMKRGARTPAPGDFLPKWDEPVVKRSSEASMKAKFAAIKKRWGKKRKR